MPLPLSEYLWSSGLKRNGISLPKNKKITEKEAAQFKELMPETLNRLLIKLSPSKLSESLSNSEDVNLPLVYRKNLDEELCCPFDSLKGRELFIDALSTEFMNIYFKLSQQFVTQDENNSCALACLVMVLNGLSVDPGRKWKYPWRWFDENMINSCKSIPKVQKDGVGFESFLCISRLNYVDVRAVRASSSLTIEDFRADIKASCCSTDKAMIVNFSRKYFNQVGSGHYAVIGGYSVNDDVILIMDTARFKYISYWVKVEHMLMAMKETAVCGNGDTENMPRGYAMLQKSSNASLSIQISRRNVISICRDGIFGFIMSWKTWIKNDVMYPDKFVTDVIHNIMRGLCDHSILNGKETFKLVHYVASYEKTSYETRYLKVWQIVEKHIYAFQREVKKIEEALKKYVSPWSINIDLVEPEKLILKFITNWIILWPYDTQMKANTYEFSLSHLAKEEYSKTNDIGIQLNFLGEIARHCGHKSKFMKERQHLS